MVDLRKLSIPRNLDGRDGLIGVTGHIQLEGSSIVCGRLAEGSDQESGLKRLGGGKELDGKVFLGLKYTSAVP